MHHIPGIKNVSSGLYISPSSPTSIKGSTIKKSIQRFNRSSIIETRSTHLCNKVQQQNRKIPFINSRRESGISKHLQIQLGKLQDYLCFSSSQVNSQNSIQRDQTETRNIEIIQWFKIGQLKRGTFLYKSKREGK